MRPVPSGMVAKALSSIVVTILKTGRSEMAYKRTIQGIEHKEYSMQNFHFAGSSQPFQRIIGEAKTKVWEAPTKQKISAQAAGRKRRLRESVATLSMLTLL